MTIQEIQKYKERIKHIQTRLEILNKKREEALSGSSPRSTAEIFEEYILKKELDELNKLVSTE